MLTDNHIKILYEIAMSIGNSTDIDQALKQSLTTMLRKLNARLIAIFDDISSTPIKSIPIRGLRSEHHELFLKAKTNLNTNDYHVANYPTTHGVLHILTLPSFGFLLIERHESIDVDMLNALEPICHKLVSNISACHHSDQLKEQEKVLQKSVVDLKKAQEAKDLFLANMSHEIRTPLNGIIGFLHQLEQTTLSEEQEKFLSIIDHSANSLLGIINDILDFSKIESGNLSIESIPTNIKELIHPLGALFSARAVENGSILHTQIAEDCDQYVLTDPLRLKQIISNFLSNAVKFTKNGDIWLSVSCHHSNAENNAENDDSLLIIVDVKDTGIGISPERLEKLCQPFTQADASISREFGGTGLGLSISKNLIDMMSGTLRISSELGNGSSFGFSMPVKKTEHVAKQAVQEISFNAQDFADKYILIVEDNMVNQMLMKAVFKKIGIVRYDIANNGSEAFEAVQKEDFDLVLMDIHMPVMGGEDATLLIRAFEKREERKSLPIIALTANALSGDAEHYMSLGMNDVLTKPLNVDELKQILIKFLL